MSSNPAFCPLILSVVPVKPLHLSAFLFLLFILITKLPNLNCSSRLQPCALVDRILCEESTYFAAVSMIKESQCCVRYFLSPRCVQNRECELHTAYHGSSGADGRVPFFPQSSFRILRLCWDLVVLPGCYGLFLLFFLKPDVCPKAFNDFCLTDICSKTRRR